MLSVVIPAYNEENCIKLAYAEIQSLLEKNNIEGEFIFVDDGSSDNTWTALLLSRDCQRGGTRLSHTTLDMPDRISPPKLSGVRLG